MVSLSNRRFLLPQTQLLFSTKHWRTGDTISFLPITGRAEGLLQGAPPTTVLPGLKQNVHDAITVTVELMNMWKKDNVFL